MVIGVFQGFSKRVNLGLNSRVLAQKNCAVSMHGATTSLRSSLPVALQFRDQACVHTPVHNCFHARNICENVCPLSTCSSSFSCAHCSPSVHERINSENVVLLSICSLFCCAHCCPTTVNWKAQVTKEHGQKSMLWYSAPEKPSKISVSGLKWHVGGGEQICC